MAWRCTGRTNAELISNLAASGLIKNERVLQAMSGRAKVDRAHYCPDSSSAYEDSPQSIGHGATISAPHMHASACESLLAFLHPTARVLDIGSGSGYLTHVLANLVAGTSDAERTQASGGKVIGIDHIQPLVTLATNNMCKSTDGRALLEKGRVEFICGDGRKGYPEGGPYDAIHVGAAAQSLHAELLEQLKSPGRMFIPVEEQGGFGAQWIWVVDKDPDGKIRKRKSMGVRYVPLTDAPR
ncbi:hypothetical protein EPUS_07425 [Endocarpon pusillum Z07020]|uniref:Protein-L-isoaspartate O-methyltransferase n=1 Tax=Endocarpon pusillum (strain Z07020 / HMAS-L-300199) TaxID=1263415 RepID=U1G296_ENDPU|nr:uncharacterized protein EPUS_07425 [Endocarpon pusillum Z07020]ERF71397.1 hypothetical protein EPUS_07425 [Endocarpon pusillum Z07020]